MSFHYQITILILVLCCLIGGAEVAIAGCDNYEFIGNFRDGCEATNAVDGDWETWTAPQDYGESASIIEIHEIPSGASGAFWKFKCYRNNIQIEVRASYWDYSTSTWIEFYEVPYQYTGPQICTPEIPSEALVTSPLKIKMYLKNAVSPQQSAQYYEGIVDWVGTYYECEGIFRSGFECSKAVDGDWASYACPQDYGDSVNVIEHYGIPNGVSAAAWQFRILRNWENIAVKAYYWDYAISEWALLLDAPIAEDTNAGYTYTLAIPPNGLINSPLKTKMYVKNASSPLVSGYYYEGAVDWIYDCTDIETLILGNPVYVTSLYGR